MLTADPVRATTAAQRRTNASWLREQVGRLNRWIADNGHRWPTDRVVAAQRAILEGDEDWCPSEVSRG